MSKAEYEAHDPKCVCDGLNRVLEMAKLYKEHAETRGILNQPKAVASSPEVKEKALKVVDSLLEKLRPEDAQSERGKDWLQRARAEALACKTEKDGCLLALEWVRAAIHEDHGLRAKLTCQKWKPGLGLDFVDKQPYERIFWAMCGIAGFGNMTVDTAISELEDEKRKHNCDNTVKSH